MHTFAIILAWAVVSSTSAWSSSEVSCASCGLECQKACGTRNFRACCFNFQRRRRSQSPSIFYSLKGEDDQESTDVTRLLRTLAEKGLESPQLPQILRSLPQQNRDDPIAEPLVSLRDSQFLSSVFPAFLQESSEEEDVEDGINSVLPSQAVRNSRPSAAGLEGNSVEDMAISRLISLGLHHPSSSFPKRKLKRHFSPSVSEIRK